MTVLEALILGLVQGVTEFLPVSSSAHLVLVPEFFNIPAPAVAFDVLLHVATLVAVVGYFIGDVVKIVEALFVPKSMSKEDVRYWRRLFFWLVIGSVPAGIIGLALSGFFESLFSSTAAVGIFLVVTSALLVGCRPGRHARGTPAAAGRHSCADGLGRRRRRGSAIRPWPSRRVSAAPGSTISAGIFLGFDRETAARFAFLLSIPAILGAFLFKLPDLGGDGRTGRSGAGSWASWRPRSRASWRCAS